MHHRQIKNKGSRGIIYLLQYILIILSLFFAVYASEKIESPRCGMQGGEGKEYSLEPASKTRKVMTSAL